MKFKIVLYMNMLKDKKNRSTFQLLFLISKNKVDVPQWKYSCYVQKQIDVDFSIYWKKCTRLNVPIVNFFSKNQEIVKLRIQRNFSEGEFTIHPEEKDWNKTIIHEVINKMVVRIDLRLIHFIDRNNVKLTQNQTTEMTKNG